jgi:hypothetical protein
MDEIIIDNKTVATETSKIDDLNNQHGKYISRSLT